MQKSEAGLILLLFKIDKDLRIRHEIVKLWEENIWKKTHDISLGDNFLNANLKTQGTKAKHTNKITPNENFSAQQRKQLAV
jgi:hypothetical protein